MVIALAAENVADAMGLRPGPPRPNYPLRIAVECRSLQRILETGQDRSSRPAAKVALPCPCGSLRVAAHLGVARPPMRGKLEIAVACEARHSLDRRGG